MSKYVFLGAPSEREKEDKKKALNLSLRFDPNDFFFRMTLTLQLKPVAF